MTDRVAAGAEVAYSRFRCTVQTRVLTELRLPLGVVGAATRSGAAARGGRAAGAAGAGAARRAAAARARAAGAVAVQRKPAGRRRGADPALRARTARQLRRRQHRVQHGHRPLGSPTDAHGAALTSSCRDAALPTGAGGSSRRLSLCDPRALTAACLPSPARPLRHRCLAPPEEQDLSRSGARTERVGDIRQARAGDWSGPGAVRPQCPCLTQVGAGGGLATGRRLRFPHSRRRTVTASAADWSPVGGGWFAIRRPPFRRRVGSLTLPRPLPPPLSVRPLPTGGAARPTPASRSHCHLNQHILSTALGGISI